MNTTQILDKIRDVVGPQCEDASAAVIELRELLGLLSKSGESIEPIGDLFSQVNRRSAAEVYICFRSRRMKPVDIWQNDDGTWTARIFDYKYTGTLEQVISWWRANGEEVT